MFGILRSQSTMSAGGPSSVGGASVGGALQAEDCLRNAWYRDTSTDRVHLVAELEPNAFGLFDCYGNVSEVCRDTWFPGSPRPTSSGGPAGAKYLFLKVARGGRTYMTRHHRWVRESGVRGTDRNVHEHEVLSLVLHYAIVWDSYNIGNSAAMEIIARRLQLIEEAVSENPDALSWEGARLHVGLEERRGGALMMPNLRSFVASEMGKEAAILKEKRKAKEAGGGKGGGKDKGGSGS